MNTDPGVRWVIDFDAKREPMFADEQGGGWVPLATFDERVDALVAERDEAKLSGEAARIDARAAVAWFENHFVDEDGEPDGLTLTEMFEHVYRWGDAAWAQAGAAESSRDRLAASLRECRCLNDLQAGDCRSNQKDKCVRCEALSSFGSGGTHE